MTFTKAFIHVHTVASANTKVKKESQKTKKQNKNHLLTQAIVLWLAPLCIHPTSDNDINIFSEPVIVITYVSSIMLFDHPSECHRCVVHGMWSATVG